MRNPLTEWITTNYGKFWKRWKCRATLLISWETCMQVKKQQVDLDMEQQTGSKLGKEYVKPIYCHPAYLTSMKRTSCKIPGWMHKQNQDCREKYQQPQMHRWYDSNGRKLRGTKEPLEEGEKGEWESWLKTQHSKNKDHGNQSYHFMANRWGKNWNSDRLFSLGSKNHCR